MANPARQFDSLTYANKLRKAGVPEQQANLQAEALFKLVEDQLLNKQDLEKVELKLSGDIKEVKRDVAESELRLKAEIKDSELRLIFRLTAILTLVGAVLKFLPSVHF